MSLPLTKLVDKKLGITPPFPHISLFLASSYCFAKLFKVISSGTFPHHTARWCLCFMAALCLPEATCASSLAFSSCSIFCFLFLAAFSLALFSSTAAVIRVACTSIFFSAPLSLCTLMSQSARAVSARILPRLIATSCSSSTVLVSISPKESVASISSSRGRLQSPVQILVASSLVHAQLQISSASSLDSLLSLPIDVVSSVSFF